MRPEDYARSFSRAWDTNAVEREEMMRLLGVKDSVPCDLLIARDTEPSLLLEMYGRAEELDWELSDTLMAEEAAQWIDELGWLAMPLELEGEWTLFAFGRGQEHELLKFRDRLGQGGILEFSLQRTDGKWSWPGPISC